jgi:phosphate:Na+ symporter
MVLGSNIGTTIDAVLAAIGTKLNARRAAAVHVLFNVTGTLIAMLLFSPFLRLIEFIVPGELNSDSITIHLAMLHTVFNVACTILFLPFTRQIARLVERLIRPGDHEPPEVYTLDFPETTIYENAESYVFRAEREIVAMSDVARKMLGDLSALFSSTDLSGATELSSRLAAQEEYADQMQEELSRFLVKTSQLPLSAKTVGNVRQMIRIVDDLESVTDDAYSIAMLFSRSVEKKMSFRSDDIERLGPYMRLVEEFMQFVHMNLNKPLSEEQLAVAKNMESEIDKSRRDLKKIARKRLEDGADVKAELLYIDIVRHIEKIGDHAFSISEALATTA